jgi:hypothetical protein
LIITDRFIDKKDAISPPPIEGALTS